MTQRLLVLGAGPKAVALAAKASALRSCNFPSVPEIVVIEQNEVAGNWAGELGYTSGKHRLGTPPEKDVGFPYGETFEDPEVTRRMLVAFSWQAFLISGSSSEFNYGEWIDRGRPHPKHTGWAEYLKWVWDNAKSGSIRLVKGTVSGAEIVDGRWRVSYQTGASFESIDGDGLAITGPGVAKHFANQPESAQILDGKTFWLHPESVSGPWGKDDSVCVIGSGETAASIIVELIERCPPRVPIYVLNRKGTIFSRGEGFHENRLFTDPGDEWSELLVDARQEVIDRADRGVFSLDTIRVIDHARNVQPRTLDVKGIQIVTQDPPEGADGSPSKGAEKTYVRIIGKGPNREARDIDAKLVIVAMGFDPWWFTELLPQEWRNKMSTWRSDKKSPGGGLTEMEWDLSVPRSLVPARLHIPMLAGLARGPGFPNLSCLGTLADRILRSYVIGSK